MGPQQFDEPLHLDVSTHGERALVAVHGELDDATAEQLRTVDVEVLAAQGCRALALDLEGVEFMDSSGIGALVALRNHATGLGLSTTVDAAPRHIRHTLAVAGLAGLFGLKPDA